MIDRRPAGRRPDEMRPIRIELDAAPYAEGSCLISVGNTRVLCAASVEESPPAWLKGRGTGWVTAEYAMLPRATHTRTQRERGALGGRTQEIQRLIGRSLRAAVDLAALGERTIRIDCDVLQADGGTRTASITGGSVALRRACDWLVRRELLKESPFRAHVAAISAGVLSGTVVLDLDYAEDSRADTDLNLVAIAGRGIVEIQGTAERQPFSADELSRMVQLAMAGTVTLFDVQNGIG